MRGFSAQAVQSASSGEREHFEDAAAAISAADTEFVGLPSHGSQFRGACWLSPLFYCTQTPRWRFHCGKRMSNALSRTAGTARSHCTLGQGTCYRLARAMAESVHLLERTFDFLQRRKFRAE